MASAVVLSDLCLAWAWVSKLQALMVPSNNLAAADCCASASRLQGEARSVRSRSAALRDMLNSGRRFRLAQSSPVALTCMPDTLGDNVRRLLDHSLNIQSIASRKSRIIGCSVPRDFRRDEQRCADFMVNATGRQLFQSKNRNCRHCYVPSSGVMTRRSQRRHSVSVCLKYPRSSDASQTMLQLTLINQSPA